MKSRFRWDDKSTTMKIVQNDFPKFGEVQEGRIQFIYGNFFYDIGCLEGTLWMNRQTLHDHLRGMDTMERIGGWVPENQRDFKFIKGPHFPEDDE